MHCDSFKSIVIVFEKHLRFTVGPLTDMNSGVFNGGHWTMMPPPPTPFWPDHNLSFTLIFSSGTSKFNARIQKNASAYGGQPPDYCMPP